MNKKTLLFSWAFEGNLERHLHKLGNALTISMRKDPAVDKWFKSSRDGLRFAVCNSLAVRDIRLGKMGLIGPMILMDCTGMLVSCPINNMAFVRQLPDQLAVFQGANDEHI